MPSLFPIFSNENSVTDFSSYLLFFRLKKFPFLSFLSVISFFSLSLSLYFKKGAPPAVWWNLDGTPPLRILVGPWSDGGEELVDL
jgi:hypothetical protein